MTAKANRRRSDKAGICSSTGFIFCFVLCPSIRGHTPNIQYAQCPSFSTVPLGVVRVVRLE